jgi:proton glutamate symport protein
LPSLATWIVIAMAAGGIFGYLTPESAKPLAVVTEIFLRLIRSIVAPVLFGALVTAVAGSAGSLGRLGWRALLYFEVSTALALILGWGVVAATRPGEGARIEVAPMAAATPNAGALIEQVAPSSVMDAMARGDVLQIVVFSLLFGAAVGKAGGKGGAVLAFAESLTAIAFQYTRYVMYLAPAAVFAAMAVTVAGAGGAMLESLARFIAAAWVAQVVFAVLVIGGSLKLAAVPLGRFASFAREPFLVAFATTSSAAALPQTLESMERFGVPRRVLGIVAPLSLSFNLTGSCIHLAMCAYFVAQAAGMELSVGKQAMILLTLKLTSKGVAGIPRANFVVLSGLFAQFGLPVEGLAVLLGIDALIDPIRTSVNVLGHCAATAVLKDQ